MNKIAIASGITVCIVGLAIIGIYLGKNVLSKEVQENNVEIEQYINQGDDVDKVSPTIVAETEVNGISLISEIIYNTSDNPVVPTNGADFDDDEISQGQYINPDYIEVANELEVQLIELVPEYVLVRKETTEDGKIELYLDNLNKVGFELDSILVYIVETNGEYTVYPEYGDLEVMLEKMEEQ